MTNLFIVCYARLKKYIESLNISGRKITTLVDYYGLENDFPNYDKAQ